METYYLLDSEDLIAGVGGDWDKFAEENRSPDASTANVVGRPLASFINGTSTLQFLQQIFFACRSRNAEFSMLCRCDAPFVQRLYRMEVSPQRDDGLLIRHRELDVVRFKPGSKLVDLKLYRDNHRCSSCGRFEIEGEWIETFVTPAHKNIVKNFTVCPRCREAALLQTTERSANAGDLLEFPRREASN